MEDWTYTITDVTNTTEIIEEGITVGTLRVNYDVVSSDPVLQGFFGYVEKIFRSDEEDLASADFDGKALEDGIHKSICLTIDKVYTMTQMRHRLLEAKKQVWKQKGQPFNYQPKVRDKHLFEDKDVPLGFHPSIPEMKEKAD